MIDIDTADPNMDFKEKLSSFGQCPICSRWWFSYDSTLKSKLQDNKYAQVYCCNERPFYINNQQGVVTNLPENGIVITIEDVKEHIK